MSYFTQNAQLKVARLREICIPLFPAFFISKFFYTFGVITNRTSEIFTIFIWFF